MMMMAVAIVASARKPFRFLPILTDLSRLNPLGCPSSIPPQDDLQDRFLYQKAAEQCIRQSSPPYPAQASHTVVLQLWNRTGRGVRAKSAVSPRRFRPAHDRVNAGAHSSSLLHYFLIPLSGPIWLDPNNSTQRVSWTVSLRLEMPFSPMRPSMPVCLA